jgi:hypothetical protein
MGLPLNLAMTASEIAGVCPLPKDFAWMACHFSPDGEGLTNLPDYLPDGSLLILNDSIPCGDHDIRHISKQLQETVVKFK